MAARTINLLVRTGALAASTLAYHQEGYRQEGGERVQAVPPLLLMSAGLAIASR
jgi:hypothetical protein